MSYILDALRKSEAERRRDSAVPLAGTPQAAARNRIPVWTWLVIGALLLATAALAARLMVSAPPVAVVSDPGARPAPVVAAPDPITAGAPSAAGPLRPIAELADASPELPSYRLGVLAYSPSDPGSSSAWINGRRYFVGERLEGGAELAEVRPDGAVLAHAGRRYLLTTR